MRFFLSLRSRDINDVRTGGRRSDGWTAVSGRDFAWRSWITSIRVVGRRGLPKMDEIVMCGEVWRARNKSLEIGVR